MSQNLKLFDYINVLFGSDEKWDSVSNYDKIRNDFMTRRLMSIKFPIQANLFNTLKQDPVSQAECWRMIGSKFKGTPGFIYTKTKATAKSKKSSWYPKESTINYYLKINEIGMREFKEIEKFNQSELFENLQRLEKQISDDVN